MKNNIYKDFTRSYYNQDISNEFTNQEILDYFYQNVGNEIINEGCYNLVIEDKKGDNDEFLKYDRESKTFYFNKRTYKILSYINSKQSDNLVFDYNYAVLELLNEILAVIALERDLKNSNFIATNPFFCYGIYSADIFGVPNVLRNNYIFMKKAQYLNRFYNECIENYSLDDSLKVNLNNKTREYLLSDKRVSDKSFYDKMLLKSILSSRKISVDDEIINKFGGEIYNMLNDNINVENDGTSYLLNSILCGKKLSKAKKQIIGNKRIYILDYAERELIKDLNEYVLKLVK